MAKTCGSETKCLICGDSNHHKGCPNKEKKQPKCGSCKGPHVAFYKGCPAYKNRHSDNMWWTVKNHMPQLYAKTRLPHNPRTFTFSAKQLIKFVANVAIQVTQPQVCYANSTQDATDKKSSLCRRVSEAAQSHLGVDITGISLFDAIGQLRLSAPSAFKPKTSLANVKPPSNSSPPPKSSNQQPSLNHSAPLAQLTRLSPNNLNPLNRTPQ